MRYEKLSREPRPADHKVAFLYHDNGFPVRDHYVCYNVSGFERPRLYVVAAMSSEDTDFYDYHGVAPLERGLEIYSIYRVHGSPQVNGYDQHHIVICFADKSIEFTGQSFGISTAVEGESAIAVLLDCLRPRGTVSALTQMEARENAPLQRTGAAGMFSRTPRVARARSWPLIGLTLSRPWAPWRRRLTPSSSSPTRRPCIVP